MSVRKNDKRYEAQWESKIPIRLYNNNANPSDTPIASTNTSPHSGKRAYTNGITYSPLNTPPPLPLHTKYNPQTPSSPNYPKAKEPAQKYNSERPIDTLQSTLLLPAGTAHRKLPKDPTPKTTTMHPS